MFEAMMSGNGPVPIEEAKVSDDVLRVDDDNVGFDSGNKVGINSVRFAIDPALVDPALRGSIFVHHAGNFGGETSSELAAVSTPLADATATSMVPTTVASAVTRMLARTPLSTQSHPSPVAVHTGLLRAAQFQSSGRRPTLPLRALSQETPTDAFSVLL